MEEVLKEQTYSKLIDAISLEIADLFNVPIYRFMLSNNLQGVLDVLKAGTIVSIRSGNYLVAKEYQNKVNHILIGYSEVLSDVKKFLGSGS